MINARFIESEVKKAEQELTKMQTRIAELRQHHATEKSGALRAKQEVELRDTKVKKAESEKHEQEIQYSELERKLKQLAEEKRRTEEELRNETKILAAAQKRSGLANRMFSESDAELQGLIRKEQTFQRKVTELQKELQKLDDKIRHVA